MKSGVGAKALAVLVALALLVGAAVWLLRSHDKVTGFGDEPSALSEPVVVTAAGHPVKLGAPLAAGSYAHARVDFFVDGWSVRSLGTRKLTASYDGQTSPVKLAPVSPADLRELLATTPSLIADVLSRQVSGSAKVACQASGCSIAGTPVDLVRLVTDPSSVPGYGAIYRGWGVRSLLYKFSVDAGDGNGEVSVSATGYDSYRVAALPTGGTQEPASRYNGFYRNRYLLGAAFGHVFVVDPQWRIGGAATARYEAAFPTQVPAAGAQPVRSVHHVTGLGEPWLNTTAMSPSVLTYLSSPTSGCDVGVLCAPADVDVTLTGAVHDQQRVCTTIDGIEHSNIAVFDSAVLTANFPHPVAQFGLWGGKTVEDFGGDGTGLLGGGVAPVVSGPQSLRWRTVGLLDGDTGQLRVIAGVYAPAAAPAGSLMATLVGVSTDGAAWHRC